ncbi:MAG: lipopolysaccharide biosynthesis protein [Planctomycetota bacterium]|nr:lipopolysaccharide biosynthesis protein [Planctomycetota bacterium]
MKRRFLQAIKTKFVKDTLTLQASGFLTQASGFAASAVLAFALGAHGQGLFVMAVTLQALLFNLVNVGVVQATVSQLAAANARGLHEKVAAWLAFLVKTYLVTGALMIGVGFFALPYLCEVIYGDDLPPEEARNLGVWAWWLTWWILIDTPRAVAQVAFHATRRMTPLAQLDAAHEFIRLFLTLGGVVIFNSPAGAVLGEIASRACAAYLALNMYRNAREDGGAWLPSWGEIWRMVPSIPLQKGLRLGLRLGLLKNATTIFINVLPRLLLSDFASFAWVAYFNIAQKIMGLATIAMQGVSRNVLPALAEKRGHNDFPGFRKLYWRASLIGGAAIAVAIGLGLVIARPMIARFYPADYTVPVFRCCWILAIGMIPTGFGIALDPFYILTNKMKANLTLALIGAIVTIPINVYITMLWPEEGPVWGQAIYLSWSLVHFTYIAFWLRNNRHATEWST